MRSVEEALDEQNFPGNDSAFSQLASVVAKGNIIIFSGAGSSSPLYPGWSKLLLDLVDEAQREGRVTSAGEIDELKRLADSDPLEAASSIEDYFTKHVFRSRLGKIFRKNEGIFNECHQLLVRMGAKGIITLNYDSCLEAAFSAFRSCPPQSFRAHDATSRVRWLQHELFGAGKMPILHLHGTPDDPSTMVFTSEDYDQFYSDAAHNTLVEQAWRSERLLVVGFGFADPFLTRAAERTLRQLPTDLRHFALIGVPVGQTITALSRRTFAKKYRLNPVFYRVRSDANGLLNDHSDLQVLLASLVKADDKTASAPQLNSSGVAHHAGRAPIQGNPALHVATREFEQNLNYSGDGTILYAEPRLLKPIHHEDPSDEHEGDQISVLEIVSSGKSYIVSSRSEFGASTLCRRINKDLLSAGERSVLRNANDLPNYKKKLLENFQEISGNDVGNSILILDDFVSERHERLLRELRGLNYFKRFIICTQQGPSQSAFSASDIYPDAELIVLNHLGRPGIRHLAQSLFDTADADLISDAVNKVYSDLLELCIPLTPANVIMYLTILYREGDFKPLNRVEIIERYVNNLLRRPSDAYVDAFNVKNKIDVISLFAHALYDQNKVYFNENDWKEICKTYISKKLLDFDYKKLLFDLKKARIIIDLNGELSFKYRMFFVYFLGLHVAKDRGALESFIQNESYLSAEGLVEIISGVSTDSSKLVGDIVDKLERCVAMFNAKYAPSERDPFERVEWPLHALEEERLWRPLAEKLSAGPARAEELDKVKSSLLAERRTEDQSIVLRTFDEMERRLVAYHQALIEALRNSDLIEGELKVRSIKCIMESFFIIYQVGLVYAPLIAKHNYFVWNGIAFTNKTKLMDKLQGDDAEAKTFKILIIMSRAVAQWGSERIASRKLGEVFNVISKSELIGFRNLLIYSCIIHSKPRNWSEKADSIIGTIDKKSIYLWNMLTVTYDQFHTQVNSGGDREKLKRLIALIRTKRDLKKDHPGSRVIGRVLERLEQGNAFSERGNEATE